MKTFIYCIDFLMIMKWVTPKYNKSEVDQAGEVLVSESTSEEEKYAALVILENWRACHSYPMHVFKKRLKNAAEEVDKRSFTVQRLKRVPAICAKLRRSYEGRSPTMNLSQMQDIGGCRAVLASVNNVKRLCDEYYMKANLKHKRVGFKDYITYPKRDGYRSIHLVYEYRSDKRKQEFNKLRIEIQMRSKLQHLWATAIETVGFFTRQALKSSEGEKEWLDFFKLLGSAFALMEACPLVPDTPLNKTELYSQIKTKEKELGLMSKMLGWASAMEFFTKEISAKKKKKVQFFLLELDILGGKLNIKAYTKAEELKAIEDYSSLEKRHSGQKDFDVVLVGVDKMDDLKKAYPNYFVDTKEFVEHVRKITA